jgi:hypothetical protein
MRSIGIVLATAIPVLIVLSSASYAAPAATPPTPSNQNPSNDSNNPAPVARQPQQQRPFYCFGDAACEREMARQGRPVADAKKRTDEKEGPYIQGIPGQIVAPGSDGPPTPVIVAPPP